MFTKPVVLKGLGFVVLALSLLSCGAPPPRHSAPGADHGPDRVAGHGANVQPAAGAHVYRIDAARSELRVLVYRAGPMARFGHNHVLINRALDGEVVLKAPRAASSFSFTVPVADFVVDEPQAREQEGADFPGEIPDAARTGTLHNMQSPALLDAAAFPVITVDSVALTETPGGMTATLAIHVAGHESHIDAPFTLDADSPDSIAADANAQDQDANAQHANARGGNAQRGNPPRRDAHTLNASGSMELRQSALGLTPFSILMGALQVQDTMRVKFKITAIEL